MEQIKAILSVLIPQRVKPFKTIHEKLGEMFKVLQMTSNTSLDVTILIAWITSHSTDSCTLKVYSNPSYSLHLGFWLDPLGKTCFDLVILPS